MFGEELLQIWETETAAEMLQALDTTAHAVLTATTNQPAKGHILLTNTDYLGHP